jgi:hypothetical protein
MSNPADRATETAACRAAVRDVEVWVARLADRAAAGVAEAAVQEPPAS